MASGADGVVLSDVLMGLPEYELPDNLRSRLDKATGENSHVVNGFRFQASALAPVLRRLLAGAVFWEQSDGWLTADSPSEKAWPVGMNLVHARDLANHKGLNWLLRHVSASETRSTGQIVRPPEAPKRPSAPDEAVAVIGLGCRLPGPPVGATCIQDVRIVEVPQVVGLASFLG